MPKLSWHVLVPMVVLTSLAGGSHAQLQSNRSGLPSLRVGDYTDQLSNGTSLPLYTLIWRAVGSSFYDPVTVNQTLATDANTAFLEAKHTMTYTVANIKWNVFIINTTRTLNSNIVEEVVTDSDMVEYSSCDLLMRTTFTQDSVWRDLGVTEDSHRAAVAQNLAALGWNMTAVVPMQIALARDGAAILQAMPLPVYTSHQVVVQVSGTNVVPTSLQKQNLITDTLLNMLASDHVFLIRLVAVDEVTLAGNQGSATMTYIMQKSSDTVAISTVSALQALQLVLGQVTTPGSQQRSAFTAALAKFNINATAAVLSDTPQKDDSIQDQLYLLTSSPRGNNHLGAIVGSSVGSGVALLLLATAFVVFGRSWLKSRRLKKQTAAWRKEQQNVADLENGKVSFHDSGSSLDPSRGTNGHLQDDPAAAKCWDIAASDVVICKRPDNSEWLLSSSDTGQVFKAIKGGVQDVVVKVLTSSTNLARKDLRKEVEVLKLVSYDRNVVQFYGTCPYGNQTMLVLEYLEGGHLRQALTNSSDGELKWHKKGATIALDIVRGLHFLHSHGVMHMDLKASNVFLTKTYSIAKIGEVDMAQVMGSTTLQRPHTATFAYSAPELILHGPCNEKVDMYSFGVILWELITTEMPRRGRLRAIKVPDECPAEIEQLIDMCLATAPADRPTAKEAFDIISSCNPHVPGVAPPTPAPIPHQHAAASAEAPESWVQLPGMQAVDATCNPQLSMGSSDEQSRQQAACHVPTGFAHSRQSSQQSAASRGKGSSDNTLALGHKLSCKNLGIPLNGTHQPQTSTAGMSALNKTWPDQAAGLHDGQQLPPQQQEGDGGAKDTIYSLARSGNATPPSEHHNHLASGSQGALPSGMFGHLYPSPFDMADDESGDSIWCWQPGLAASGVHFDQKLSQPQQ